MFSQDIKKVKIILKKLNLAILLPPELSEHFTWSGLFVSSVSFWISSVLLRFALIVEVAQVLLNCYGIVYSFSWAVSKYWVTFSVPDHIIEALSVLVYASSLVTEIQKWVFPEFYFCFQKAEAVYFSIRGQSLHDLETKYGMLQQNYSCF